MDIKEASMNFLRAQTILTDLNRSISKSTVPLINQ